MTKNKIIDVKGTKILVLKEPDRDEYISLTDIARFKDAERSDYILQNWMRNRSTIEFIGLWEQFNNPDFNSIEFDGIKNLSGANSFSLTPKRWIEETNAIGIISKTGRYGGTYAHRDIAFEFATWISAEFKFYLIKEFQRLKSEETQHLSLEWDVHRMLSKINYRIHTDAVRDRIIPAAVTQAQAAVVYASEADLLNVALFGKTAAQWRKENPGKEGNIRDYSSLEQLLVLANLESLNAELIRMEWPMNERLLHLNQTAIRQMNSLAAGIVKQKLLTPKHDKNE